ncbi:MAG: PAS domain S-box protein [Haloferacaceae archaeon]
MNAGGDVETRILLVDPTGALDRLLGEPLAAEGFAVDAVSSSGECLSRVESGDVDGVVSAYALPELDGLRLLRSVRISFPTLPFVLVPAEGSEGLAGDALAAGASAYVPREDAPDTVVSRLRECLRRARVQIAGEGESHERYRHLIEMSPAPINVFDRDGNSIWCNRAVLDLLGLEHRDELLGRSVFDLTHPDDHDRVREELEAVLERKEAAGPTRMRVRRSDGAVRHIRVSTAIGSFLGEDVGQAVAVDVTDRVERDRQLQVLDRWLQHNIRNEMTAILGHAENIREGVTDDPVESADRIRAHAERLLEQADHERDITRVLAQSAARNHAPVDVTRAVERAVSDCRAEFPDADVEVTRADDFEADAVPQVAAAVRELVRNAIQHNDTDAPTVRIEVAAPDTGGDGTVRVADDGPGIPAGERDSLVLEREIDDLNHGSGLGLVLVYWAVRASDGDVSFAENDPRGSVVTLTLPRYTAD